MKVKDDCEEIGWDGWYDLFEGGYFEPKDYLDNEEDAKRVKEAMNICEEYKEALRESPQFIEM